MLLEGKMLIGQSAILGDQAPIYAINPADNQQLSPAYPGGKSSDVNKACLLASDAFEVYRSTSIERRAQFLECIAEEIELLGEHLTQRALQETGLPSARLEGERGRTCGQLRMFANTLRTGEWLDVRIDPAQPERVPLPRADLRQQQIPLGPVAVFGASNFPLAFSVAGGDTASALAAGCPVIVKAHSAHPGTSEMVGRAIQKAVKRCELPEGVFSLIFGSGREVGQALVKHPEIQSVGFTGSRSGGTALLNLAQGRAQPIPVYAEMSSINPVILMPSALECRAESLGAAFIASLNMGAGQFCTNPGLLIARRGASLDAFISAARQAVEQSTSQTMLTPGIHDAYVKGVDALKRNDKAREIARGTQGEAANQCCTGLFVTTAKDFLQDASLQAEIFGATALIVACDSDEELRSILKALEGQLTATLQMDEADYALASSLLPILERKAGRILANGWPTGVEVCDAMVHGGPYPATSDGRSTSVGTAAIQRFLRAVCYQDLPETLLSDALKQGNPLSLKRLVNGNREQ